MDDLFDKIKEIQELAKDIEGKDNARDRYHLVDIIEICNQILIDHQINEQLQRLDSNS